MFILSVESFTCYEYFYMKQQIIIIVLLIGKEAFRELVKDACGSRREVMIHLVNRLDEEDDVTEALICARLFSVPPSDMPPNVRALDENGWR